MKKEEMRQDQTGSVCKTAQNNLRKIDTEAIRLHIRGILQALGDDPDREGLKETPERVAKMYEEVFEGMCYSNQEIADMFRKNFAQESAENSQDMVLVKNIEIFSYCEHHLALMYDMKVSVAYIPRGNVLGLSKIARIADMVGKRLQLQERTIAVLKNRSKVQIQMLNPIVLCHLSGCLYLLLVFLSVRN